MKSVGVDIGQASRNPSGTTAMDLILLNPSRSRSLLPSSIREPQRKNWIAHMSDSLADTTKSRTECGRIVRIWFSFALSAAALAACGPAEPTAPPKPHVSVAYPIVKKVIDWDDFIGRFEAIQNVAVTPRISGAIETVLFKNGQDVKAGQPLFIIDQRPFQAAYHQAVGDLDNAKAAAALARANYERGKQLIAANALSRELFETRRAAEEQAAAQVETDKAAAENARLNLEFTTIKSPVDGRASDRKVSIGDIVTANTTQLTTVVTLDPIWFTFEGAESFLLKYQREEKLGQRSSSRVTPNPLEIQLADENGYPHRGHMVFVDNAVDPLSGTIRAKAEFTNADHFLTPGM